MVTLGLLNSLITNALVRKGYLAFPWRLFPHWTQNNIIYDFLLLPGFALLMIQLHEVWDHFWFILLQFVFIITLQDYLVSTYTTMLAMKKWTLYHTALSAFFVFFIWYGYYYWLSSWL
ncbi:CBO0543 family protein [Ammoniphilus sp. YIM 78166]|uniref:CBO0543 family protein n=1 Tax=Ammoniphilus sp. YIM 78166 TaxID=1644106 RepID=UPI0035140F7F